ncbi:hypothetical protein HZ326_29890 [Fusarium oxysporum f. sp. albedinis]|nr:hypothetical protein HZ326_29890 [Fusarium oxysporum f. sp. albedinis]
MMEGGSPDFPTASGVPLTPSVTHTYDKMRQGQMTLAFNGIAATQEMHCLKEKALRRARLEEGTSVICKYGPIRVSDARLRVARDEYNRQAAQEEEEHRLLKRAQLELQVYLLQKSILPPAKIKPTPCNVG